MEKSLCVTSRLHPPLLKGRLKYGRGQERGHMWLFAFTAEQLGLNKCKGHNLLTSHFQDLWKQRSTIRSCKSLEIRRMHLRDFTQNHPVFFVNSIRAACWMVEQPLKPPPPFLTSALVCIQKFLQQSDIFHTVSGPLCGGKKLSLKLNYSRHVSCQQRIARRRMSSRRGNVLRHPHILNLFASFRHSLALLCRLESM